MFNLSSMGSFRHSAANRGPSSSSTSAFIGSNGCRRIKVPGINAVRLIQRNFTSTISDVYFFVG